MTDTSSLTPSPWTPERIAILTRMWKNGVSTAAISRAVGGGLSGNAVIGKANRLGLGEHASSPRKVNSAPRVARRKPVQRQKPSVFVDHISDLPKMVEPIALPVARKVPIAHLTEHTCRWPIGDPRDDDFSFCGASPVDGKPYCSWHCRIAYQPRPWRAVA